MKTHAAKTSELKSRRKYRWKQKKMGYKSVQ